MKPCDTCATSGSCIVALAEQPTVTEFEADGVWAAQIVIALAGSLVPQHSHEWDHLTMLATGRVRVVENESVTGEYSAPAGILIKAGVKHLFETLTDNVTLYCIHNTARTGRVEVQDEHQIVGGA